MTFYKQQLTQTTVGYVWREYHTVQKWYRMKTYEEDRKSMKANYGIGKVTSSFRERVSSVAPRTIWIYPLRHTIDITEHGDDRTVLEWTWKSVQYVVTWLWRQRMVLGANNTYVNDCITSVATWRIKSQFYWPIDSCSRYLWEWIPLYCVNMDVKGSKCARKMTMTAWYRRLVESVHYVNCHHSDATSSTNSNPNRPFDSHCWCHRERWLLNCEEQYGKAAIWRERWRWRREVYFNRMRPVNRSPTLRWPSISFRTGPSTPAAYGIERCDCYAVSKGS